MAKLTPFQNNMDKLVDDEVFIRHSPDGAEILPGESARANLDAAVEDFGRALSFDIVKDGFGADSWQGVAEAIKSDPGAIPAAIIMGLATGLADTIEMPVMLLAGTAELVQAATWGIASGFSGK